MSKEVARPEDVIDGQLDAYNRQDLDRFCSFFAPDISIVSVNGDFALKGKEELRARYEKLFSKYPNNRVLILSRIVQGPFVFDHEYVTGRDGEPVRAVCCYHIESGLIKSCTFWL